MTLRLRKFRDDMLFPHIARGALRHQPRDGGRGAEVELETFAAKLEPLRAMLKRQPFIGGATPLFADYIVFGPLQWVRITSPKTILEDGDPVKDWFERRLNLHDGLGRSVTAA